MKRKVTASLNANHKRDGSKTSLSTEREKAGLMESWNAECKRAGSKAMSNAK